MPRYELFIFDFDGTLVDTAPDIAYHLNSVLSEFGFAESSLSQVKKAIGWGVHQLMRELAPALDGDAGRLEKMVTLFKQRYAALPVSVTRPYPSVEEMLEGPLSGFQKAIVTNKPQNLTLEIIDRLGWGRHFRKIIGGEAGFAHKPDPASTRYVMEGLGVAPAKTLFIGDSAIDRDTARGAGTDFIWMDYGYDDSLAGSGDVKRFSSAADWKRLCS